MISPMIFAAGIAAALCSFGRRKPAGGKAVPERKFFERPCPCCGLPTRHYLVEEDGAAATLLCMGCLDVHDVPWALLERDCGDGPQRLH